MSRQTIKPVTGHVCINIHLPPIAGCILGNSGETREIHVRVAGQLIVNGIPQLLHAAFTSSSLGPSQSEISELA